MFLFKKQKKEELSFVLIPKYGNDELTTNQVVDFESIVQFTLDVMRIRKHHDVEVIHKENEIGMTRMEVIIHDALPEEIRRAKLMLEKDCLDIMTWNTTTKILFRS